MPARTDINSVLIIGSGPIVIGQACEFDYSATQACRALKAAGYRVILVNSNPATIMTDPNLADATYIEPLRLDYLQAILDEERPDALLPTMGGQTALNLALELEQEGVLEQYGVELIGASSEAIEIAENRALFKQAMEEIGLHCPESTVINNLNDAEQALLQVGLPCILRPSFTLGGTGGGVAKTRDEYFAKCASGLQASPINQVQIDQSLLGWKEYEMEVVRDKNDNCIIVCSIENFDPMGVHTGDSITVAPALTLTDREYQVMRTNAMNILRKIGVETGGSNVQFAVDPNTGEQLVIEMNPRVSRSSALASKATGFPIARVAAQLAIGYTLDELTNDVSDGQIPASFEPTIDYIVTKIPRFDFEKFPGTNTELTIAMKSVGEAMAIGRTFKESLQKAMRSLENGWAGFEPLEDVDSAELEQALTCPSDDRLLYIGHAFREGMTVEQVAQLTGINTWFLSQIRDIIETENSVRIHSKDVKNLPSATLRKWKSDGFSDRRLADLLQVPETQIREQRYLHKVHPSYKRVDSCAAEFDTTTSYLYSTYHGIESETTSSDKERLIILGGGPNRIGQGIEFDYCCVHACYASRAAGREVVMVNCNPETVSTDFDISDILCMEPVTAEDVLEISHALNVVDFVPQFGGQTPLRICDALEQAGMHVLGTSNSAISIAEDRDKFRELVQKLNLTQPANATATNLSHALEAAKTIDFPLVVRPSFVLGGRAMEIVYHSYELEKFLKVAFTVSGDQPVLLDRYLEGATEVDVEIICDGTNVVVAAVMEHIEEAGVHSGDSACTLPAITLSPAIQNALSEQATKIALELQVVGLMNVQFAIDQEQRIYLIEVNPRASRTVPFVGKCTGYSLPQIAMRCALGQTLPEQGLEEYRLVPHTQAVKEAVFPFNKFPESDQYLGPEMRSTGEVMGHGEDSLTAYYKSQLHTTNTLPQIGESETMSESGGALLSVKQSDRAAIGEVAKMLIQAGYTLYATDGTGHAILEAGCEVNIIKKLNEGTPNAVGLLEAGKINLVINTCADRQAILDSAHIRQTALKYGIYTTTTIKAARQVCRVLTSDPKQVVGKVVSLQKILPKNNSKLF